MTFLKLTLTLSDLLQTQDLPSFITIVYGMQVLLRAMVNDDNEGNVQDDGTSQKALVRQFARTAHQGMLLPRFEVRKQAVYR